ncbi:dihydrofolate reductase [Aspergillus steynii IBT 23096]|uniref:Dihydrofolate reductase n=1 Tax=Aspergillus steynii IBT 23096 TaxID=1392250 RepID=A0A2I2G2Q9_9EURO|nr:dihydrofolate reductase [Aspergillus steynii IBT 23096]PLB47158.1 dihydrofolate reductase [Aspergillus steynii IBT 23096]
MPPSTNPSQPEPQPQPQSTMPLPKKPLTLIVATTPLTSPQSGHQRLGIGLNGTLPWPRIKTDMSFFARVTTRPPSEIPGSTNAMIMGRKTYDSVPASLRPLGKRLSVILSRGGEGGKGGLGERVRRDLERKLEKEKERERELAQEKEKAQTQTQEQGQGQGQGTQKGEEKRGGKQTSAIIATSLPSALDELDHTYSKPDSHPLVGHVFVIGGAEIYRSALDLPSTQPLRIVMTHVEKLSGEKFECDTFFPVDEELEDPGLWRTASAEEVTGWVGEVVTGEWIEEGDVKLEGWFMDFVFDSNLYLD